MTRKKQDSFKNNIIQRKKRNEHLPSTGADTRCPYAGNCGACSMTGLPYEEQLKIKQKSIEGLLGRFGKVEKIIGMPEPFHYRHKVHRVFGYSRKTGMRIGTYEERTHRIVEIGDCLIEDKTCQDIITTVKELAKSFKYKIYDEDTGYGLLRHVLVRKGCFTGEILVVLVMTDPVMPGKNNFVKTLTKAHPEITSIVLNMNDRNTTMVLGKKEKVLFGPGYIRDTLCGLTFRISAASFYQVNPVQAETVYRTAIAFAALKKGEVAVDAYCGTGTIGLSAVQNTSSQLVGIELSADAVRDARQNAKDNGIKNASFYVGDAGEILSRMASGGEEADIIFMDPPRTGSNEVFMKAAISVNPSRIIYISCGPQSLARDLKFFTSNGFSVELIQPIDMFPMTPHVETVCLLSKLHEAKNRVNVSLDMDELDITSAERKATI